LDGLTLHDLDDDMLAHLRIRAAQHGHSMEDEAQRILMDALCPDSALATSTSPIVDEGPSPKSSGNARRKPPASNMDA
jgi:plasmid stability protein